MLCWQTSGRLYDEAGNALPVKRAFANVAAGQTEAEIIAAVNGRKLRVLWIVAVCGGTATTLVFLSGSDAGTSISCTLALGANGIAVLPENPFGWFETDANAQLTVNTGSGSTIGIHVGYVEVP